MKEKGAVDIERARAALAALVINVRYGDGIIKRAKEKLGIG